MMQRAWPQLGPQQWMRYVNKQVNVKAGKDEEHRGWVMTVDPVTASVVLVSVWEDKSVRVLMGACVQEVQVLQDADPETIQRFQTILDPPRAQLQPDQLTTRTQVVQMWLEKNRVPVVKDGDLLKVGEVLTIKAPYRPEDCLSHNQIVLDRIQRLVRALDQDAQCEPAPDSQPR